MECASCAAKGTIRMARGETLLDFTPDELQDWSFHIVVFKKHGLEIKGVATTLRPRMHEVPERMKRLLSWRKGIALTPPSLSIGTRSSA